MTGPVLYERDGHVALLTLNRPEALNAVNAALADELGRFLEQAAADDGVRAIVVTGAGRAFCAGADLKEIAAGRSIAPTAHPEWGFAGLARHWVSKPLVAAVNGYAMGGGTEIALACDLVVASEQAAFGLPEVKRGLFAAAGGVIRLQRQIPLKLAAQLVLTGDPVDAATARQWGLVNDVVPADEVVPRALALARRIAANAPLSVQQSKRVLHQAASAGSDWDPAWGGADPWQLNAAAMDTVFGSADALEGATAFASKRAPVWTGH
ncbi:MAG: crotonase/enoyl-CoA hydratase family protein [Trebonia sp.]|jgi:crotonobetainyl-CoA hydratase